MKVYNTLGNGFQEVIYQRVLAVQIERQGLGFKPQTEMPIYYDGRSIGTRRIDFFVEEKVMVKLNALKKLGSVHKAHAINYC